MQINKSKKVKLHDTARYDVVHSDFKDLIHDGNSSKSKPMLIALGIIIAIIIAVSWSAFAYLNHSGDGNSTYKSDTSQAEENSETTADPQTVNDTPQAVDTPSSTTRNPSQPSSSANNSTPSNTSTYDPSKCEPLNSEATSLRQSADQKKITYDNAFAARKNYGYFYDQYGNSTDASRAYDVQEAQLNLLQTDWQDALNKGNAAYTKYQECRASL